MGIRFLALKIYCFGQNRRISGVKSSRRFFFFSSVGLFGAWLGQRSFQEKLPTIREDECEDLEQEALKAWVGSYFRCRGTACGGG